MMCCVVPHEALTVSVSVEMIPFPLPQALTHAKKEPFWCFQVLYSTPKVDQVFLVSEAYSNRVLFN